MLTDSRLLQVNNISDDEIIGFLFISSDNKNSAHIGYLLAQTFWGQGLASELLQGFIVKVGQTESWTTLNAGVDKTNTASANLLKKHGFLENLVSTNGVVFYQYEFLNRNEKPITTL